MIDLYNGDCLEIMQQLIDKGVKVDAIITDIPYGTTDCKWDNVIPFEPMWDRINKLIKDNGAVVLTATQPFASKLINSNIDNFKHEWIWNKQTGGNFMMAKYSPIRIHESVLVFGKSKNKVNYYPIMEDADEKNIRTPNTSNHKKGIYSKIKSGKFMTSENYNIKKRYPKTLLNYSARVKECNSINRLHPTQKPVELMEYLVKTYTNEGDTVLDFTMGSGSTGEACKRLNRNFIGIELDKDYFEIAKNRIDSILI